MGELLEQVFRWNLRPEIAGRAAVKVAFLLRNLSRIQAYELPVS